LAAAAKLCCCAADRLPYEVGGSGKLMGVEEATEVVGIPGNPAAPSPNNAAWNDKSAADLFLSSRTTGLTGMAGLLAAEVADVLTGLTEAEFTGVCHGLALDLSLVPLPVEVWGENMGCLA